MSDSQNDPNLAPFAEALKKLTPQPPHLSRDALLFEAGKAAASPRLGGWTWPSTAAAFAGLSFVLGAFLLSSDPPIVQPVDRVVFVPQPAAPQDDWVPPVANKPEEPKSATPSASDESSEKARALQVRRDVLRWGIDMLPESKSGGGGSSPDVEARRTEHWLGLSTFALPGSQPKKPAKDEEDEK